MAVDTGDIADTAALVLPSALAIALASWGFLTGHGVQAFGAVLVIGLVLFAYHAREDPMLAGQWHPNAGYGTTAGAIMSSLMSFWALVTFGVLLGLQYFERIA